MPKAATAGNLEKKKNKKKREVQQQEPVEEKPPKRDSKRAKATIDDIFSRAGKGTCGPPRPEGQNDADVEKVQDVAEQAAAAPPPPVLGSKDDIFGEAATKQRKRTDEGYAVYTEDELGLSKSARGGGTDLCPFDCECCY